jgi:hypothetical protein
MPKKEKTKETANCISEQAWVYFFWGCWYFVWYEREKSKEEEMIHAGKKPDVIYRNIK